MENKPDAKEQEHQESLKKSDVKKKTKHQEFMEEHERIMQKLNENIKRYAQGGEVQHFADGGAPDAPAQDDEESRTAAQPMPGQPPVNININAGQPQPGAPAPQAPQIQSQPQQAPKPTPSVLAPQQAPAAEPAQSQDPEGEAIDKAFSYDAPENVKESLNAPSPMQSAQAMYAQAKDQDKKESLDEYDKFAQDLTNGHITPKTYQDLYAKKDTLGKIGTLFGLLVGGAGAGLTHTENPIIQMMDKQINNDLQAQQHSKENALNFWKVNQQDLANKTVSMGNIENAKLANYAGSKIKMYQTTAHHLSKIAENAPPAQQAKYMLALQALKPVMDKEVSNLMDLKAAAAASQGIIPAGLKSGASPAAPYQGNQGKGAAAGESGHILTPGSDQRLQGLATSGVAGSNLDALRDQKAKADLADKALDTISEQFGILSSNAGPGMYARSQGHNLQKIPLVGHALEAASNFVTDTPKNRTYETANSQVMGAVRGALQGNVSEDLLDKVVDTNTPKYGDTPELLKQKQKALKDFIASHTRTDLLRTYGMSKK